MTWSKPELDLLRQLMDQIGTRFDADALRQLLLDRCKELGLDTSAAEAATATPRQARRTAA